jgi:hypothetical protein
VNEDEVEKVKLENHTIIAPEESGVHVYHISTRWKQGDGTYAFSVKAK